MTAQNTCCKTRRGIEWRSFTRAASADSPVVRVAPARNVVAGHFAVWTSTTSFSVRCRRVLRDPRTATTSHRTTGRRVWLAGATAGRRRTHTRWPPARGTGRGDDRAAAAMVGSKAVSTRRIGHRRQASDFAPIHEVHPGVDLDRSSAVYGFFRLPVAVVACRTHPAAEGTRQASACAASARCASSWPADLSGAVFHLGSTGPLADAIWAFCTW